MMGAFVRPFAHELFGFCPWPASQMGNNQAIDNDVPLGMAAAHAIHLARRAFEMLSGRFVSLSAKARYPFADLADDGARNEPSVGQLLIHLVKMFLQRVAIGSGREGRTGNRYWSPPKFYGAAEGESYPWPTAPSTTRRSVSVMRRLNQ